MAATSTIDPPPPGRPGVHARGREATILFALAALGLPLVGLAAWSLPPLAAHVDGTRRHPFARLLDTLTVPAHIRGFAFIAMLMVGAFSVIPFISTSLVANAGVTQAELPAVFVAGGLLTLLTTPLAGRLVDQFVGIEVTYRIQLRRRRKNGPRPQSIRVHQLALRRRNPGRRDPWRERSVGLQAARPRPSHDGARRPRPRHRRHSRLTAGLTVPPRATPVLRRPGR